MPKLTAPLVGMHFRPPAKDVVQNLPSETLLELRRQPMNEYDPYAVQVFLHGFSPSGESPGKDVWDALAGDQDPAFLGDAGWVDPLPLGYVDSKKTGSAKMFSDIMDEQELVSVKAYLGFALDGKPQVTTEFEPFVEEAELDEEELEAQERLSHT